MKKGMKRREYYVVVERDGNGGFKGDVAQFFSCKSQGKTLDDLMANMRKAIRDATQKGCETIDTELHGMYQVEVIVESTQEKKEFCVVVEDDLDSGYIGIAPELKGCLSHGSTLEELMLNMEEVIHLCLEDGEEALNPCFFGIQRVAV